jgi:hypothetical protein
MGASIGDRLAKGKPADDPDRRSQGKTLIIVGAVIAALGLVITIGTFSMASQSGGVYFVAYGPIIAGVATMMRGARRL